MLNLLKSLKDTHLLAILHGQGYFWRTRWQAGEREAQEDIDKGHIFRFEEVDEALNFLSKVEE